jgi:hypothetical protein
MTSTTDFGRKPVNMGLVSGPQPDTALPLGRAPSFVASNFPGKWLVESCYTHARATSGFCVREFCSPCDTAYRKFLQSLSESADTLRFPLFSKVVVWGLSKKYQICS